MVGTKSEMERLIKDANKVKKAHGELGKLSVNSFADIVEAIHIVQNEMGITGTTSKEASETLIGSISAAKASWTNFLSGTGDLKQVWEAGTIAVNNIIRILKEALPEILKNVYDILPPAVQETLREIEPYVKATVEALKKIAQWAVKAFRDTVKWVKQAITVIDKYKNIIVTIGALLAAWNAKTIFMNLLTAITKTKVGLLAYKTVVIAVNVVQAIWNGLLATGRTLVALFTGQVTLAQVATGLWTKAQMLLNAAMAANPIGVVLVAAVALTAAVIALAHAIQGGTEEEKKQAKAMQELADKSKEVKDAYTDLEEQQNKSITSGLSEMQHIQELANELKTLADSQGNVAEKDRARAEFILNELNNALGTEYKMIDGQIQKYEELSASIDKQIEKKRMEIMFQAREEEYRKSLSEWTDLQKQKEEARLKVQEAQAAFEEHESRANADRLNAAIENYDNLDQAVKQASTNIRTYEDAYTENLKGNTEAATKLLLDKEKSFTSLKDVATKSQEEQTRILKEQEDKALQDLEEYRKKYKEGVAGYTSDGLIEATNYAAKAKEEYKKIGQNMNEGLEQGLSNTETKVTEQVQEESWNMLDWFKSILGINSPSKVLYGYGKNINQGLINGLNSNSGSVTSTMGRIGQNLLSRMKNVLGIHSPSRVFRDAIGKNIALGIGEGFESEMESVENDISKTLRNIAPSLELGNLFDLSPTLHNTTTSNSNVNVQVINNMETDFMGNLISNIKTYSNGAKNDYNYGMT